LEGWSCPRNIRDRLGPRPGAEIEISEKRNELVLKPLEHEPSLKSKDGILVFSGKATGDLRGAVRAQREERLRKFAFGK